MLTAGGAGGNCELRSVNFEIVLFIAVVHLTGACLAADAPVFLSDAMRLDVSLEVGRDKTIEPTQPDIRN
jgi:hypothetical protein